MCGRVAQSMKRRHRLPVIVPCGLARHLLHALPGAVKAACRAPWRLSGPKLRLPKSNPQEHSLSGVKGEPGGALRRAAPKGRSRAPGEALTRDSPCRGCSWAGAGLGSWREPTASSPNYYKQNTAGVGFIVGSPLPDAFWVGFSGPIVFTQQVLAV